MKLNLFPHQSAEVPSNEGTIQVSVVGTHPRHAGNLVIRPLNNGFKFEVEAFVQDVHRLAAWDRANEFVDQFFPQYRVGRLRATYYAPDWEQEPVVDNREKPWYKFHCTIIAEGSTGEQFSAAKPNTHQPK